MTAVGPTAHHTVSRLLPRLASQQLFVGGVIGKLITKRSPNDHVQYASRTKDYRLLHCHKMDDHPETVSKLSTLAEKNRRTRLNSLFTSTGARLGIQVET